MHEIKKAESGNEDVCGSNSFDGRLDTQGDKILQAQVVVAPICPKGFLVRGGWPVGLGRRGNLGQHGHGFDRIIPHGRFSGQHHAIGSVQDGIGHRSGCRDPF